jgi:glycosyltransferase involved in cell wall biosynthesis
MTPKLSILIPTTESRKAYLDDLLTHLYTQIGGEVTISQAGQLIRHNLTEVEILVDPCEGCRIGEKRNRLLDYAHGEYLCFFDDDDTPGENYIAVLMAGVASGSDCVSLRGIMTIDGANPQVFEHSIRYRAYATNGTAVYPAIRYERYPNHLNAIKTRIAKRFKFPNKNYGEDTEWATKVFRSGAIKTEHYTEQVIYYYKYRSKK